MHTMSDSTMDITCCSDCCSAAAAAAVKSGLLQLMAPSRDEQYSTRESASSLSSADAETGRIEEAVGRHAKHLYAYGTSFIEEESKKERKTDAARLVIM